MFRRIFNDTHSGRLHQDRGHLREMRANRGSDKVFTADEVYKLYVQQYPGDEEMMRRRQKSNSRAHSLQGYLNGQLFLYSKNPHGPVIEFLDKMSYRFV